MDFVHCNQCLVRLADNVGTRFHVTQCASIYCDNCVRVYVANKCAKCASNNCHSLPLVQGMKHEVEICFRQLSSSFKELEKVETFQRNQRKHLIDSLVDKNLTLQKQNYEMQCELKSKDNELSAANNEIEALKKIVDSRSADNQRLSDITNNTLANNPFSGPDSNKQSFGKLFDFNIDSPLSGAQSSADENKQLFVPTIQSSSNSVQSFPLKSSLKPSLTSNESMNRSKIGERNASQIWNKARVPITDLSQRSLLNAYTPSSVRSDGSDRSSTSTITPFSIRSTSSGLSPMGLNIRRPKMVRSV